MRRPERGFSLVELAVALLVLALLAGGLAVPLAAQLQARRVEETRRRLDEAREALLGFAAAHGRLPCPATAADRGEERFAPGGSPADGACATFHAGFLPGATLGLSPLDPEGFVPDAWGGARNRIRYAVFGGTAVNGVANPLTRANGMQQATLAALAAAQPLLLVCAEGSRATTGSCGPASSQLTRRAAFVLLSSGANGALAPAAGSDEARNQDGDAVFVQREPSVAPGREFDDLVSWTPLHLLAHRLLVAGRLP